MLYLRSLAFFAYLVGAVIVFGVPVALLGGIWPYRVSARLSRAWARSVLFGLKWICDLDYRVEGLDRLPQRGAIVLCKHQSAWETIAIRALFPVEQTWVLKQELIRVPIFGWALNALAPIAIDRSKGRKAIQRLLTEGRAALEARRWVIVFPEGTRTAPGERGSYGIGGAMLAERSGYPVVPVAHNAGVYWARRSLVKYPGTITMIIGPQIESDGRRAQAINAEVEHWIEDAVAALPQGRNQVGRRRDESQSHV
jgi:1-acyl-sn-glycerol-3-phosphate acyltransferase